MSKSLAPVAVPLRTPLFRGPRRLHVALLGLPGSGRRTLFEAVASTSVQRGTLSESHRAYRECVVQIGLDEARLVELPSMGALHLLGPEEHDALHYLLWGEPAPAFERPWLEAPPPHAAPDVIIQVIDALALGRQLELTLELRELGRPMVVALNRMDEAARKGLAIDHRELARRLGVPVVPMVALMGQGIAELFATTMDVARAPAVAPAPPISPYLVQPLRPLQQLLDQHDLPAAFQVPPTFLLMQVAEGAPWLMARLRDHFPQQHAELLRLRAEVGWPLPRPLAEELHADRHHRAASLFEEVSGIGPRRHGSGWRYWLDELFLHPRWGLVGSLAVFAAVLFVVFEVSAWLDGLTAARLVEWISAWQPQSTAGVVGRAVADALIGLVGIVIPYMLPLVMLLVALEQTGVMQRIAFVVDRGFHQIGLHGSVAVPFLLGLGCNVPALSAVAGTTRGRDRFVASLLITFVPCSARSAIILALAGKYLGGLGVFAIFLLTLLVIALMGRLLRRHNPSPGPGQVLDIPPYELPSWRPLLSLTWMRTRDILTIVTPLLVGGSVVLALLAHVGADAAVNTLLMPVTQWWLGLPLVLGVPILFGVLRKELSLLMVYQALGTFEVGAVLDWVQIATFLVFLTFYFPCVSTFAVLLKTLGRRDALWAAGLSVATALVVSGAVRWLLEVGRYVV